jgi:cytochrome c556
MSRIITSTITIIALGLGFTYQSVAETSADDAYEYRESIMTALKGHAGAISMTVRGLAGDPKNAGKHARAIADLGTELHAIFQEGSAVEGSETLPAVWDNPEEFAAAVAKAEEAMAALGAAADGDIEAIGAAFMNVGKACKGCHEDFRQDDD